jgi:hypothetical protein
MRQKFDRSVESSYGSGLPVRVGTSNKGDNLSEIQNKNKNYQFYTYKQYKLKRYIDHKLLRF